jgi:hypothetical protein
MFWKSDIDKKADGHLRYNIKKDSIVFYCIGIGIEDRFYKNHAAVTTLFNDFLLGLSKEKKVFVEAYRLPDELEIFDSTVILSRAEVLLNPFLTFFHLSEAKMQTNQLEWARDTHLYYFKPEVEWTDFLATVSIDRPIKLIKNGILSAHFSSTEHAGDFWFESNKTYEAEVLQLIESLSKLGFSAKPSSSVSYPFSSGLQ